MLLNSPSPLDTCVPCPRPALDRCRRQRIDFQVVGEDLEKLQFFLTGMTVSRHDFAGEGVGRFPQTRWQGGLDLVDGGIDAPVAGQ